MTTTTNKQLRSHEDVLEAIAEAIDIPERLDQIARDRYASIGKWLDRDSSNIKQFNPEVSPQGSFLLGTVIRPVGDADEFDVDLVCTLDGTTDDFTMSALKEAVGSEIKSYAKANGFLNAPEDGRRCWTLEYSDKANFHMDILPALPNDNAYRVMLEKSMHFHLVANEDMWAKAIAITDKTDPNFYIQSEDWPVSNPKGYAVWFKSRQVDAITESKHKLMEREFLYASVDDIPEHKVKTPLQRAIQLLKRHRDSMFEGDENKPISVIITTLAAHCYNDEATISETLRSILKGMGHFIEDRQGVKWISNPVNPDENFADKWEEDPDKERNFFKWMDKVQRDFGLYLSTSHYSNIPDELQEALTKGTVSKVLALIIAATPAIISSVNLGAAEAAKIVSDGGATQPWCK